MLVVTPAVSAFTTPRPACLACVAGEVSFGTSANKLQLDPIIKKRHNATLAVNFMDYPLRILMFIIYGIIFLAPKQKVGLYDHAKSLAKRALFF